VRTAVRVAHRGSAALNDDDDPKDPLRRGTLQGAARTGANALLPVDAARRAAARGRSCLPRVAPAQRKFVIPDSPGLR
jgi:hypothetical protein